MPGVRRVLFADDSESWRTIVARVLRDAGHEVRVAPDGEAAVRKFLTGHYDVIVLDMDMPVLDGRSAAARIRKIERRLRLEPTPIIAVSAHREEPEIQADLEAGCTAFLPKPLGVRDVVNFVNFPGSVSDPEGEEDRAGQACDSPRPRSIDDDPEAS